MEWWQAVILGLVEGLTEYLPVSSTGHLVIAQHLMGLGEGPAAQAVNTFDIVVQSGAILAVLGLYRQRVGTLFAGLLGRDADGRRLLLHLCLAFVPSAALGLLLDDWIDAHLLAPGPVAFAVLAGAVVIVAWQRFGRGVGDLALQALTARGALLIGLAQCFALWPGTSRSLTTILAALLLGLSAPAAAEFSFLLGLLTLSAATGYKALKDGGEMVETLGASSVLLGLVVATLSAALAVKWFVAFLNRRGLMPFAVYRFALGAALILMLATGVL
jgi:undecaprenyl-diphosphatase